MGADLEERLLRVLCRYMSGLNARTVLRRSRTRAQIPARLSTRDLPRLQRELEAGVRLFVPAGRAGELMRELAEFASDGPPAPREVAIHGENDILMARTVCRDFCERLGARSFSSQGATTAVSELARNIVAYARRGSIELVPRDGLPPTIFIRAVDQGPGIPDVDHVLSGDYRSKTGMGKGLMGVRRIARSFHIESGPSGTRVEAEIEL